MWRYGWFGGNLLVVDDVTAIDRRAQTFDNGAADGVVQIARWFRDLPSNQLRRVFRAEIQGARAFGRKPESLGAHR